LSAIIASRSHLTPRDIVTSSAAGVGISLLCFLPPILHFISGPLGPLIGSFIVGTRAKATTREGLLIGLGMGLIWGVIAALAVGGAEIFSGGTLDKNSPIPISAAVWLIPLVPLLYVSLLGTSGAMIGGYLARREAESRATTSESPTQLPA
jgi:hypothetical protein